MIFQSRASLSVGSIWKNHQIWQKIWQKFKKSLVQLAFNPFLHGTAST